MSKTHMVTQINEMAKYKQLQSNNLLKLSLQVQKYRIIIKIF